MEIPDDALDALKCINCDMYLSRGPVYLKHTGEAICGRCYNPKHQATRNIQYEVTAKLLKFPCKNRELGCLETVPFVDEHEIILHEDVCEHRQYVCPVLGSASCDWLGPKSAILSHCLIEHPDRVFDNPCTLTHDITKTNINNYIISAFQLLFLLQTKVCLTSGKIFHAIRLLGNTIKTVEFIFNLNVKRYDEFLSKEGRVFAQGCLAIQEDVSLVLDTNSLIGLLGGFDSTTFTVTVKRCIYPQTSIKCEMCQADVTMFIYRGENGWRCKRCIPPRRTCANRNHGCNYIDITEKCRIHELFFCPQRTKCWLCSQAIPRGSLSSHYDMFHQDITYKSGTSWWVLKTNQWGRDCLITSRAGTAVCCYVLTSVKFELRVHIPVAIEELKDFNCRVQFCDPATGNKQTYTPDTLYNSIYDWIVEIKNDEFPSWNVAFDIVVDIIKI